jgi:hypothetical protein
MKIIKICSCSVCPYLHNKSTSKIDYRVCGLCDPDDEGYEVELTKTLTEIPLWCLLENYDCFL